MDSGFDLRQACLGERAEDLSCTFIVEGSEPVIASTCGHL
jgi:hypothetical protein